MNIRKTFIAIGALCAAFGIGAFASGPAQAATVGNWGNLNPGNSGAFGDTISNLFGWSTTNFTHDYKFSVTKPATFDAAVLNLNLLSATNIRDLQIRLYQDGPGSNDTLIAQSQTGSGGTFELLSLSYAALETVHDYFLRVVGKVDRGKIGSYLGGYEIGYQVSPVPLPGAVVLFGSGLLSLIAVGRQRRANRKSEPAAA